jgi:hypothetical protein
VSLSLEEALDIIRRVKRCPFCRALLRPELESYPHSGGFIIPEISAEPRWYYTTCPKCRYQWSLVKLGARAKTP